MIGSLSLHEHSADVSRVFRALIGLPGFRARLARLAGVDALDDQCCDRLAFLVHLHDCGKVNVGFQARVDPAAKGVGHIAPLSALFGVHPDVGLQVRAMEALRAAELDAWGPGVIHLFDAILSHHGRPWPRENDGRLAAVHWRSRAGYDPMVQLGALRADAEAHFPFAITPSGTLLPDAPPFVHAIAGLVQLADWIGSSEWRRDRLSSSAHSWATDTLRNIGLDPATWRATVARRAHTFDDVFGKTPYTHQAQCGMVNGNLVILEAETGSGKTEAALWRFLRLFETGEVDGMYFALPTRTAAAQLHQRVATVMRTLWPDNTPPTVMAVPGYLDDADAGSLPDAADPLDKPEDDVRTKSVWASENPKRFFSAMIGVGTIDQALLAALRVKHAHLRASCLMRHLLVVDEVHASDAYMQRLLQQLLRDHLAAGGHAMLLSATLGAESRQAMMEAAAENVVDLMHQLIDEPPVHSRRAYVERRIIHDVNGGVGEKAEVNARASDPREGERHGVCVERRTVGEGDSACKYEPHGAGFMPLPADGEGRCDHEVSRQFHERFADAGIERVAAQSFAIRGERKLVRAKGHHQRAPIGGVVAPRAAAPVRASSRRRGRSTRRMEPA